jgi:hypothetical protein
VVRKPDEGPRASAGRSVFRVLAQTMVGWQHAVSLRLLPVVWRETRRSRRCCRCQALLSVYNLDDYCEACQTKTHDDDFYRGVRRP